MNEFLSRLENKVINEKYEITKEEAVRLYKTAPADELFDVANRIRKNRCGNTSSVCSIINAKSGRCSENCAYCAQSAHWKTSCATTEIIKPGKSIELCERALKNRVSRISLVTSGRGLFGKDFEVALENFRAIKEKFKDEIKLCASLGILSFEQMQELKLAGVDRYHHNIETCRNYFSRICTTHSYDERIRTIQNAKKAGLEICSGGIIGLGESREDRIDLALELRRLEVQSVPINILTPIKGTPLGNAQAISREDVLITISVFRFIMPAQTIRCAAGRKSLGKNGEPAFAAGANALISGDFLTTPGSTNDEDISMLEKFGYELEW